MLVYAHRSFQLETRRFLRTFATTISALPSIPPHDDLVSLLVDFGEAESAVADAVQPEVDDELPLIQPWRSALCEIARAVCASWRGDGPGVEQALGSLRHRIGALISAPQPDPVAARVAEGFAQYSLFPEQYVDAAEQFACEVRPTRVMCVGLRSIGSTLAAMVAVALNANGVPTMIRSVRPRGSPWERRVALGPALRTTLARSGASHFAIVDEGPGISGSSFAAAVDALTTLGIEPDRIALFPSWNAPTETLRSARARSDWSRYRRFVGSFELAGRVVPQQRSTCNSVDAGGGTVDLSAGQWRPVLLDGDPTVWPAVQPQHERRKYLVSGTAPPTLMKFAGLGRHGRAKFTRAEALAAAQFGPRPVELKSGFLIREWVPGKPLERLETRAAANRTAAYLAFLGRTFPTGAAARVADLSEMLLHNVAQGAVLPHESDTAIGTFERLARTAESFDVPEIAVDGRLLPHEWISSDGHLVKVDALDHHCDDFLPGCRDIAWDLAGALVEGDFDEQLAACLVEEYAVESGDTSVGDRLPFYIAAYSAYRFGYVTLATEVLGDTPDGGRFTQAASRYRRSLVELVRRLG